jgi:hypothetical protein
VKRRRPRRSRHRLVPADQRRLATASGDPLRATFAPLVKALLQAYTGDAVGAADDAARARELALGTGSRMAIAWTRYAEGEVRLDTDPHTALVVLDAALEEARAISDRYLLGVVLVSAASLRARYGDPASAGATFLETIEHWRQAGDLTPPVDNRSQRRRPAPARRSRRGSGRRVRRGYEPHHRRAGIRSRRPTPG